MPANIGSQTVTLKFFDPVDSFVVNRLAKDVRSLGIYSGGYLTRVSDVSVSLSALTCEIGDGTYQVRIKTDDAVAITVSSALPYIVLRWIYTGSATSDYMGFYAVALGSILTTDAVVGKCTFAGSTLTGFDYTLRTNPKVLNLILKAEATSPASMRVVVRSGRVNYGTSSAAVPVQQSPLFAAPGSLSRIDLVQINASGVVIITQGTIAASPVAPSYGGLVTIAEVLLTVGQASIPSTSITDVRSFVATGVDTGGGGFVPQGGIIMWSGLIANMPSGWALCNGSAGTPNLTDRFVIHADADSDGTNNVGDTGGVKEVTLTASESGSPAHTHVEKCLDGGVNIGYGVQGNPGAGANTYTGWCSTYANTPASAASAHTNRDKHYALAYIMKL